MCLKHDLARSAQGLGFTFVTWKSLLEHGKDELVFNSLHTDPISEWMNGCWYKAARPTLQASWGLVPRHRHLTEKGRRPPLTSRLPALFCQWHIELKFQSCKSEAHNAETANGFSDRRWVVSLIRLFGRIGHY